MCVETLCAVAGISYRDLASWCEPDLPTSSTDRWTPAQIAAAFEIINACVEGGLNPDLPGAVSPQPVELLTKPDWAPGGWTAVEMMRTSGVTYETLLAQRVVGSAWGTHRNRTSSQITYAVAAKLAAELDHRNITYRVTYPGSDFTISKARMKELVGVEDAYLGLVALDQQDDPVFAVAFSTAKDGGTARKNTGRLVSMEEPTLPIAVVVAGTGWAQRNETARLAEKFSGRVYSDNDVAALADLIEAEASPTTKAIQHANDS